MSTETLEQTTASTLTKCQKRMFGPRFYVEDGHTYRITATVRHDDECGNGHNTFAITADIEDSSGCCHDEVARHFPELAPFVKWHLMSTDEPLHYVANTVYHASNRDHRSLLKGEKRQLRNGRTGLPVWERVVVNEQGEPIALDLNSWRDAETRPVETLIARWEPRWIVGEGKERQLDLARSSAVWPEATDEQLCAEPEELKRMLRERLPALMEAFKRDVESLGFVY
jgi:hypothetical protein